MLNLSVAGCLGSDPELRSTSGGNQVLNFSVAVNGYDHAAKEKTTTWVRCAIWGKRAETLSRLLGKGDRVALSGAGQLRNYTDKSGVAKTSLEVTAQDVTLLGEGGGGSSSSRGEPPSSNNTARDVETDDIPF